MYHSSTKLPPLSSLRAFEASVRRGSFTRASEELHLTHGAVCRHIAALEAHFRKPLFIRHARGVVPTPEGRRFHAVVTDVLERLTTGSREVLGGTKTAPSRVTISVLPSFATRWLLPRLVALKQSSPAIEVELLADYQFTDLHQGRAAPDFAIRYGHGGWRGVHAELLMRESFAPVCAPHLIRDAVGIDTLMARLPLLHDSNEQAWSCWLATTGLQIPDEAPRALVLNDYNVVIEAAAQGLGLALGRSALVEGDLASARLVEASPRRVPSPRSYYLVRRTRGSLSAGAQVLWDWLHLQAGI
jgi:LysR family transcriptional regulator, glycine cleavage system transcriptional activator